MLPQVHADGYITFGRVLPLDSRADPMIFRLSTTSNPTISPTSSVLSVERQIVASTLLHYRVAEDEATFALIKTMIEEFNHNFTYFQPALAIVTTWQISSQELPSVGASNNNFIVLSGL